MAYLTHVRAYLRALQNEYRSSVYAGQHTAELSFRTPLDQLFKNLRKDLNPSENIQVVLEPRNQGRIGRPDWRVHNEKTLGIYGYIEGKGLTTDPFDTAPYSKQINKYLSLGHKLIITDGIDFVFCIKPNQDPVVISLIDKMQMGKRDWGALEPDPRFELYMKDFFDSPSQQQVSEGKLVELVALRTRILANEIKEYADIPIDEALNENERQIINLLSGIKAFVYDHNDLNLRTSTVFADFIAQVIMFSLLYAHRVYCLSTDSPSVKEEKIKRFITMELTEGEALLPFRNLMLYLRNHMCPGMFISEWVDECVKFLSFVQMTDKQLLNPDYHQLFELFLAKYDAKTRFDYGAFYTPKSLADFVVRLTNHIVKTNFPGSSIYDEGNTIIDPCCGTGSFLQEVVTHDISAGKYNLCGFEILPAPYMLANYRMKVVEKQKGQINHSTNIFLTNTLSDFVLGRSPNVQCIEGYELMRARSVVSKPIKLIIGNPPCSEAIRKNPNNDSIMINELMDDFRPPLESRRARQNTQKQINNPFMQFLRWSCKILMDSDDNSVMSVVVPLSFLEGESYKYARKYLFENFSDAWVIAIDADARTGIRSDSLFRTLQGRAVIILTRKYNHKERLNSYHFADYSSANRDQKEKYLSSCVTEILRTFTTQPINKDNYALHPSQPFNSDLYSKFWLISGKSESESVFLNYCSGIKLAPTAAFTHVKSQILKRRSKEIASGGFVAGQPWFSSQDKPPKEDKIVAFQNALNTCGDICAIDQLLSNNIRLYSFRPYLRTNVLLWTDLLRKYSRIGGGGTRLRPEIIKAFSNPNTIGFAMAHAPKDLNPTLTQFVSFCWYYPDNDMCTRGNSYIYMNQYPCKTNDEMVCNINSSLLEKISSLLEINKNEAACEIVFYVYAILCSQVYLDAFEGALFTVNSPDRRARIPFVNDKNKFLKIVQIGKKLAELEKADFVPENILNFDYQAIMDKLPSGFYLKNSVNPFDEEHELLMLTDGVTTISIDCPIFLQKLNISGYDLIKSVWLKFNSYNYTHCEFTKDDMKSLLDFLNTLAKHTEYVAEIDDEIRTILSNESQLIVP